MIRRAFRISFFSSVSLLVLGASGAFALDGPDVLPTEVQEKLKAEYTLWTGVWPKLLNGSEAADPSNAQTLKAIDAAAKWASYRLTWGLEREEIQQANGRLLVLENISGLRRHF